jgi:hypothetical protein
MLVLGVRGPVTGRAGRRAALAVGATTVVVVGVIAAVAVVLPGWMPPRWAVGTLDVVAWSGAGAAGIVALVAGSRSSRALVRRTGFAFTTLSAAHAVRIVAGRDPGADRGAVDAALELAAVGMLLVAAVAFFVAVVRGMPDADVAGPALPAPVPRPADSCDELPRAALSLVSGATIGPVTDGIRILAPSRAPASGQGRGTDHPRRWPSGTPTRRPRPGRGRPPGRRGRD